jgi:hypothetical protein
MRENNTSATSNLGKEMEQQNPIKIITGNSKNYKESHSTLKISEHENTGLPTRTGEPASGYFYLDA